jgi:alkylation response protein AidB-like acyl-CoA dehydrogenase
MDTVEAVSFSPVVSRAHAPLVQLAARRAATTAPGDVTAALDTALLLGREGALVGAGYTAALWEALATTASADLGAARAIEPHLDALAIVHQAGAAHDVNTVLVDVEDPASATWGVFAAEGGAPLRISRARGGSGGWQLDGVKPWCSLADRLAAALVTATDDAGERHLVAVNLGHPGVNITPGSWHARGLTEIPSGPVSFTAVPAIEIGEPGWYLRRAGFSWGGISVAACWFGGAVGVARTVFAAVAAKENPDRLLLMHLGAIDEQLESARRALAEAASLVDVGAAEGAAGRLLAKRVRSTVARACEHILTHAAHALGPAPLALDPEHAKRVADLQLYVRQHHAERDDASLGEALVRDAQSREETTPW